MILVCFSKEQISPLFYPYTLHPFPFLALSPHCPAHSQNDGAFLTSPPLPHLSLSFLEYIEYTFLTPPPAPSSPYSQCFCLLLFSFHPHIYSRLSCSRGMVISQLTVSVHGSLYYCLSCEKAAKTQLFDLTSTLHPNPVGLYCTHCLSPLLFSLLQAQLS